MTGTQLKTLTENILDGQTIDEDFFLQLANIAKNKREEQRPWQMLLKLNSALTASVGNNYTSSKALPTDWRETIKMFVGEDYEYFPTPFIEQHRYRNASRRYLIDVANEVYYILGNVGKAATIYHYYKQATDDILIGTSPVWPDRFQAIIAYDVAGYFQVGVDADDIYARMSPANRQAAQELELAMIQWDTNLQARAQGNRVNYADSEPEVDIGLM